MLLERYKRPVHSIFDLLGRNEDDMTYALGYVASRSEVFAQRFLVAVGMTTKVTLAHAVVRLQTAEREGGGRTDIELDAGSELLVVLEAKRGPVFPTADQLRKYLPRLRESRAKRCVLVAVTNASDEHARVALSPVDGVAVEHVSWRRVFALTKDARRHETSNRNKLLLEEFLGYLSEILGMETAHSNMVLVVSLSSGGAWGLGFKEVAEQRRYFDPVKRHRRRMPNYLAFRFEGRLQSIHHVERVETFTDPTTVFPEATVTSVEPHFAFHLGPPIKPPRDVRNGPKIARSMRVWCAIDTLLTSATITDALAETQHRRRGTPEESLPAGEDETPE